MKVDPLRYDEFSEKKIVKLLQPICQVMGLAVPDLFNYSGVVVFFIIYSVVVCLFMLSLCTYAVYFKTIHFYAHMIVTGAVLDTISTIGTTAATVTSIAFAVIFRRRKIVQVVRILKDVEKALNEKFGDCQLKDGGLLIHFGCLEFLVLSYIIFDSMFKILGNGFFHYSWSIILHVNMLMISLVVMQVKLFATTVKQYFAFVNDNLTIVQHSANCKPDPQSEPVKMKFFLKIYDRLCDVIDLMSKSFGIQIAAISFIIITCLIGSLNLLMKFAVGNEMSNGSWKYTVLIADIWSSIIYIAFGVIVATCYERASDEANNTSIICYKILLDFPSCPKTHHEETTKNELLLLAEQLSQTKVKFSAAGLFTVDHTMLYMIFGSIATYLVIVLQFK